MFRIIEEVFFRQIGHRDYLGRQMQRRLQVKNTDKYFWKSVGFGDMSSEDYFEKAVVLRDGRSAIVWVNRQTGHGILDPQYWMPQDFYSEEYRNGFGPEIGKKVEPSEYLRIYDNLNNRQFNSFSDYLTRETRFLEIGCSFGGILKRVASTGVAVCDGVEPCKQDALFVQRDNRKVRIYNTTFEAADLPDDFYDIIVSIEVLEHCVCPRRFLQKCYRLLRKNGLLHLEVPNHNDVLLSVYKNLEYDKFYYRKVHIHYFTNESLQKLCYECGFEGRVFSFLMYPFFNHVWWQQNHGPQPSAVAALSIPAPARGRTSAEKAINDFYKTVEEQYENLINGFMLGDCLIFQGRKK